MNAEQKAALIDTAKEDIHFLESVRERRGNLFDLEEHKLALMRIALASLMAKPVAYEVKGLLCHTLEEAEIYVGEPEPLYADPPVAVMKPVKCPLFDDYKPHIARELREAFKAALREAGIPIAGERGNKLEAAEAKLAEREKQKPDYWQFKSVNGDWLGISEQGMRQAVREGCEVRELFTRSARHCKDKNCNALIIGYSFDGLCEDCYLSVSQPPAADLAEGVKLDAIRYRFLRERDYFGADDEPGLASWDELCDLNCNEFDAAVDARMNHPDSLYPAILRNIEEANIPTSKVVSVADTEAQAGEASGEEKSK